MCCYCRYKNHYHVVCCHISPHVSWCSTMFITWCLEDQHAFGGPLSSDTRAAYISISRSAFNNFCARKIPSATRGSTWPWWEAMWQLSSGDTYRWWFQLLFIYRPSCGTNISPNSRHFLSRWCSFSQVWYVTCSLEGIDICLTRINLTHLFKACKFGEDFCLPIVRLLGTRSRPRVTRVQTSMTSSNLGEVSGDHQPSSKSGAKWGCHKDQFFCFCF